MKPIDPRHDNPKIDEQVAIGNDSPEHQDLRLACLMEAREQSRIDTGGFGDVLFRARHNARFVILGETVELSPAEPRTRKEAERRRDRLQTLLQEAEESLEGFDRVDARGEGDD